MDRFEGKRDYLVLRKLIKNLGVKTKNLSERVEKVNELFKEEVTRRGDIKKIEQDLKNIEGELEEKKEDRECITKVAKEVGRVTGETYLAEIAYDYAEEIWNLAGKTRAERNKMLENLLDKKMNILDDKSFHGEMAIERMFDKARVKLEALKTNIATFLNEKAANESEETRERIGTGIGIERLCNRQREVEADIERNESSKEESVLEFVTAVERAAAEFDIINEFVDKQGNI
ncbi:MAG: hypothetical protein AABY28_05010 [Candidatus Omnitrophota bacterium]